MDRKDLSRRRYEGYYEGSSGRGSQFEWDDLPFEDGPHQTFGDDARWKNSIRAEHHNNDQFGRGYRNRSWLQNLDNQGRPRTHYGKGPKGYIRTSEKIYEDVCEALMRSSDVDAQNIEVSVEEGLVTLTGTVLGRKMKRRAEEVVESILGVEDVINMLSLQGEDKGKQIDESGSGLGGNPHL